MADIINLLPDSVANQIAAGEVIPRPASAVKELMENAIDAEATKIQVIIKNGGSTLIQVIDNGIGMSPTDARMSFERHATSKIESAHDLFSIQTRGFRGEALASIAAVAQITMQTKRADDELGTVIELSGTEVLSQTLEQTDNGTNIAVKNLFFNVPARRRFLKSNGTEMMHVKNEFYRIVLANPSIEFTLTDGETTLVSLIAGNLKSRIDQVLKSQNKGKMAQQLIPINFQNTLVSISGFVSKPEFAQKSANQYFFVNGRFMRHPYFNKAVLMAYSHLIQGNEYPHYFIYFEVAPESIDVNVHPAKTEIKFEDEKVIWAILSASVKEVLGKFQVTPSIDFNQEGAIELPTLSSKTRIVPPTQNFNPTYNPFGQQRKASPSARYDWKELYQNFENLANDKSPEASPKQEIFQPNTSNQIPMNKTRDLGTILQHKERFLLFSTEDGIGILDQHRIHYKLIYERLKQKMTSRFGTSQKLLFSEVLALDSKSKVVMEQCRSALLQVGFQLEEKEDSIEILAVPAELYNHSAITILREILDDTAWQSDPIAEKINDIIVSHIAKISAIRYGQFLTVEEKQQLVADFIDSENNKYTPDGKLTFTLLDNEEIVKLLH